MASRKVELIIEASGGKPAAGQVRAVGDAVSYTNQQAKRSSAAGKTLRGALNAAGVGAKAGAAGIALFTASSVKSAMSFQQQISSLGSVTGAQGDLLGQLRDQAIDAGAATSFSAREAATAQTELAKGGISTANILKGGLNAALGLAAAGELGLADAASYTANAMNLFGLTGGKAGHVADALATAANATTADVSDFGIALTQAGAVAKSTGLSFDQTVVALEALAASGVKGSDAGTSLKTSLLQLVNPTDQQAEAAKKMGLNFLDAQGNFKSLGDVATMLRDRLGGMTKAQRTAALATLAGSDGVRTLTALYDAGPKALSKYEKGLAKQGTAADVAAKKQDNLAGKWEQFKGSLETLQIVVGTALLPILTQGTEKATGFVNSLTDIAQGIQKGGLAGGVAQLNNAIGGVVPVTRYYQQLRDATKDIDLGSMWTEAKQALAGFDLGDAAHQVGGLVDPLKASIGPLTTFAHIAEWAFQLPGAKTAVVSVLALVAGLKVLDKASGGVLSGMIALTGQSARLYIGTAALFTQILAYKTARMSATAADNAGVLSSIRQGAVWTASKIKLIAVGAATKSYAAAQWLLNAAQNANPMMLVVAALAALAAGFVWAYRNVGWFHDAVTSVFNWLKSNWPLIVAILTGPLGIAVLLIVKHWDTIKHGAATAVGGVKSVLGSMVSFVGGLPGKVAGAAKGLWEGLKTGFKDVINWIIRGLNRLHVTMPSVDTHLPGIGKVGGFSIGVPHIPEFARGGYTPGGPILVGERGPEIISPPARSMVHTNDETVGMLGGSRLHPDDIEALAAALADSIDGIGAYIVGGDEAVARSVRRSGNRAAAARSTAS